MIHSINFKRVIRSLMVIINNSKCNSYNSNNQTSLWIVLVTQEKETDYNIFDKEKNVTNLFVIY